LVRFDQFVELFGAFTLFADKFGGIHRRYFFESGDEVFFHLCSDTGVLQVFENILGYLNLVEFFGIAGLRSTLLCLVPLRLDLENVF